MRRCQRLLVFGQVVASANARDPERREAYILKQLQHISAWQSSIVHRVLATDFLMALRTRRPITPEALTATAQDLAKRQFAFSAAKRYRAPGQTKVAAGDAYCALFEHEYGWEIPPEALEKVNATLAICFDHLAVQTEFLARVRAGSRHMAEVPLSFRLDGTTIAATLDLVFVNSTGRLTIVDWKATSTEGNDYSRQLLVYALALLRRGRWPGLEVDAIELYEADLLKNRIVAHPVTAERLEEAEDFVYRSAVEQEALIGDTKFEDLDLSEFEVARRPTTCLHCNFGRVCIRQLETMGHSGDADAIQRRLL